MVKHCKTPESYHLDLYLIKNLSLHICLDKSTIHSCVPQRVEWTFGTLKVIVKKIFLFFFLRIISSSRPCELNISCTSTDEDLVPVKCIEAPGGLGCCPFFGGGSAVVEFLFIVTPIVGVCYCSMFCCTLLYVPYSIAIILMGKRELVALLNLSSWCLVMVEWLFLAVPWGCLRFVIVVFPDHTHLLFK